MIGISANCEANMQFVATKYIRVYKPHGVVASQHGIYVVWWYFQIDGLGLSYVVSKQLLLKVEKSMQERTKKNFQHLHMFFHGFKRKEQNFS